MNNDEIRAFLSRYGIVDWETIPDVQYFDTYFDRRAYVAGPTMVKLKMPFEKINELANLDKAAAEEYNIRKRNPTVDKAYEQYRTLLNLVR
jgi:hypothetical protein